MLSIAVVLACRFAIPEEAFKAWGWRVPFLLSLLLLAISLWMRFKLSESPVFKAMKEAGETAKNPFVESFTYPGNKKRIFVALFGVIAGLTTIWHRVLHQHVVPARADARGGTDGGADPVRRRVVTVFFYLPVGKWSDKVGRKKPIVIGNFLALILLFPCSGPWATWPIRHRRGGESSPGARGRPGLHHRSVRRTGGQHAEPMRQAAPDAGRRRRSLHHRKERYPAPDRGWRRSRCRPSGWRTTPRARQASSRR